MQKDSRLDGPQLVQVPGSDGHSVALHDFGGEGPPLLSQRKADMSESDKSWYGTDSKVWAIVGAVTAAAILIVGLLYMSEKPADAQPGCTASGLSSALATVASGTAGFLSSHPEAEAAVNSADENTIRSYFAAHTAEWQQLQGIANPLRSLRQSCSQQVTAGDVARLFDAMSA